uniref:ATP synthase complex subunit 8 n=1 Tax=Telenomus sp. ZCS-2018 TaxID=2305129 RepID=A0A346PZ52_9HYME|nr:ATP synthase F0 subunit 8 [Telenomus sp. ZCS-2018]
MPQMSPSWWMILFIFNIMMFIVLNMLIYFKWTPFQYNIKISENEWKKFFYNDKNF